MSDSQPDITNAKARILTDSTPKRRFFSRKAAEKPVTDEKVEVVEADIKQPEIPPVSFTALFRFSTRFELSLDAIGLVAAAAAGAAQPLMSLILGNLTQEFIHFTTALNLASSGDPQAASQLDEAAASFRRTAAKDASYLTYMGIGIFLCTYIYMMTWVYTGEVNAKRIRERYLQAVLRQDIQFFDNVGAGEVTTRIQTDTHLVQLGMSEKVALAVNFLTAFFTGFILAYIRSWRLALAISSILPAIMITGALMNKAVSGATQQSLKHVANGGTLAEEVISTIRTAQAFGTQRVLANLYDGYIAQAHKVDLNAAVANGVALGWFIFIIYAAYALAFSFGTTLINSGRATGGDVIVVIMSILIGSFSLALLAPDMQAITNGLGAATKLFATIDRIPDIDSSNPGGLQPEQVEGELTFEDVDFSYPSRLGVPVVQNLSITFRAGKTAALVGASGSGKSTVVSLVERFYDPLAGVVKLDGTDLKDLNLKWLRSQTGLVSQEPVLFATTIKGNVAHGLINTRFERASEEEKFALIKEACIKANADGFIMKLPLGYDTLVGERGFLLSGGQKQRVAIARAIVSDPRILLLDEATSALDTQSEGIVQDALDKAAAGRTTITIAHRLSTIRDADVIYVMGEGRVLEQGTHNDLLQSDGAYTRLVQAQKLREARESEMDDEIPTNGDSSQDKILREAFEEIPLGRKNTGKSLASEILHQQRQTQGEEQRKDHSLPYLFKRMGMINKDGWMYYLAGACFATISGFVYPAFGLVYAKGVDGFSAVDPRERRHQGDRNALWFFVIALASMITVGMQNYLFSSAAATLTAKLRTLSYKAILRQDIEFFDKTENSTGTLTARLSENSQKISGLAGVTLAAIVQAISTLIVGSILGLVFVWKLGLVAIACMPLLISTGYIRLRIVVLKDQSNKKAHEDSAQLACEAAASIRTVAALTREDDCLDQYSKSLDVPLQRSNRTAIWSHLLYAFSQAIVFFVISLVFWFGSLLVSRRECSTFDFFVALMSATFSFVQAGNVFSFVPDVASAKSAASDIIHLLDSIPNIDAESPDGKVLNAEKVQGHIRFENVHFRYPTRPAVRVLRDLSLQVEPGTYIALVGASGSGKSTVIQLLERFYDPLSGEIYLDGERISELNIQEYRKQIALVSQEPTLYAGTIRFNILLGAIKPINEVTQEEIESVCRDANILDFIRSLPEGFETEVGGKGSQLSGGQKQRIAIARALLRNPKVLLLDEATSALDSTSETVVQQALDQAAKGRTTIAIAHRLSTIQNADKIYFIKEGRVSESGTHDQLLNKHGDYYEFVQLQALSRTE